MEHMSESQGDPPVPFQATYVAERDSRIESCSISGGGIYSYVGLEGGVVETCEITRHEETVYCSTIFRKPLLKLDEAKRIIPISSIDVLLIWTRDGSLWAYNTKSHESKIFLRHSVVAICAQEDGIVAVLRTVSVLSSLKATMYRLEQGKSHSIGLKMLWESPIDIQMKERISSEASIACIQAPWSLLVCIEDTFLWVGLDERSRHGSSRVIFVNSVVPSVNRAMYMSGRGQALMLAGDLGILVNHAGEPVGDSLDLVHHGPPMKVVDAAAIGSNLILMDDNLVRIIDIDTKKEVPVPVAQCHGAGWKIGVPGRDNDGQPLIPIFFNSSLWIVCAMSYRHRIQTALKERNAAMAFKLIQQHGIAAPGYMEFLANCGIIFIEVGDIKRGIECIEQCSPEIFGPAELFPLFPEYMESFMVSDRDVSRMTEGISRSLHSIWDTNGSMDEKKAQDLQDILGYLFRVREFPHVGQKVGIDSLILHILIDLDLKEAAEAFLSSPNYVSVDQLHQRVESKKHWTRSLALLLGSDSHRVGTTIELWKQIAEESSDEKIDALNAIEHILSNRAQCDAACVMQNIEWLMDMNAEAALRVLQMRSDITAARVLDKISNNESKCRFLQLAVQVEENKTNEYLHTELALALLEQLSHQSWSPPAFLSGAGSSDATEPATFLVKLFSDTSKGCNGVETRSLRSVLHGHLVLHADYLNIDLLDAKVQDHMIPEKAIVASLRCDHERVITILVDAIGHGPAAIEYGRKFLPREAHPMLVDRIMKSDTIVPWEIAGNIIASFECHSFDATDVLAKMPDDMELRTAVHSLACMIQSMLHKKREYEMRKAMYQTRLLTLKSQVILREGDQPCVIREDTRCHYCSLKIGSKVCVAIKVHEDGAHVACLHCFNQIKNS